MSTINPDEEQADSSESSPSRAVAASRGSVWVRHLLCCCCTDVFGGLVGYVLCLYGLVMVTHHIPVVGLPLLAIVPPLLLLAMCSLRHLDGLNGCQLVLTTGCAVMWMSPLLLLQWALATTHVPTMLWAALDSRCAICIEATGDIDGQKVSMCDCWGKTFVQACVLSAFPEELLKLVAVLGVANRTHISRPRALVMYAMGAAAGFATVENILYVLGANSNSSAPGTNGGATATALARAALCIPLHLTCGALIGVGLARRRWLSQRGTGSRRLWTLVNASRIEDSSVAAVDESTTGNDGCTCFKCTCYGGLPCCAGLAIATPAILIHTAYDGLLMAPYTYYGFSLGSPSHTRHMYVGSAMVIGVGVLVVYILSLPLMAPGVAEQDDTLEPDETQRTARWPARRRGGVNLADCVFASILCCLKDDYYDEEDARLATERARAQRQARQP